MKLVFHREKRSELSGFELQTRFAGDYSPAWTWDPAGIRTPLVDLSGTISQLRLISAF